METLYLVIVVILFALAISDLIVDEPLKGKSRDKSKDTKVNPIPKLKPWV